jgi:hypothetical protein
MILNAGDEIGVRGSICERVTIVGPGGPGGVRLPWARRVDGWSPGAESNTSETKVRVRFFIVSKNVNGQLLTTSVSGVGSYSWTLHTRENISAQERVLVAIISRFCKAKRATVVGARNDTSQIPMHAAAAFISCVIGKSAVFRYKFPK